MVDPSFLILIGAAATSWITVHLVKGPIGTAIGERVRAKHVKPTESDAALHEELRAELAAMHERLDFVERALVTARQPGQVLPVGTR